jgi:hypothetical protein
VPLAAARGLESAIVESLGDGARRLTGDGERRHELAQRLGMGDGGGAIGRSLLGIAQLDAASLGGGERELVRSAIIRRSFLATAGRPCRGRRASPPRRRRSGSCRRR